MKNLFAVSLVAAFALGTFGCASDADQDSEQEETVSSNSAMMAAPSSCGNWDSCTVTSSTGTKYTGYYNAGAGTCNYMRGGTLHMNVGSSCAAQ